MPFSGVPAKTGRPKAPSARYNSTVATPSRMPKVAAITMIARVCKVIGTGQNGTWIFAEAHSTSEPATTSVPLAAQRAAP